MKLDLKLYLKRIVGWLLLTALLAGGLTGCGSEAVTVRSYITEETEETAGTQQVASVFRYDNTPRLLLMVSGTAASAVCAGVLFPEQPVKTESAVTAIIITAVNIFFIWFSSVFADR